MVVGTLPNNVEVVDTTTDKVVRTIPLEGQGPVLQIATDSATPRYAYATTNLDQAVAVVDLEQGKQVATLQAVERYRDGTGFGDQPESEGRSSVYLRAAVESEPGPLPARRAAVPRVSTPPPTRR